MTKDSMDRIVEALARPMTQAEIARAIGMAVATVSRHLQTLLDDPREVRIADWRPTPQGGPTVAVYARGSEPDAECLHLPTPQAERSRRCREAKAENERKVVRTAAWDDRPRRDPLVAALFGEAR